jgi:hypothetical protein
MSAQDPNPSAASGSGSDEPTLVMGQAAPPAQFKPVEAVSLRDMMRPAASPPEPVPPESPQTPSSAASSAETLIGKSAQAAELPAVELSAPSRPDKSIYDQDTVVSPRLRQFAQTPSQPLRPPPAAKPAAPAAQAPAASSSTGLYMLIGIVSILIVAVLVLVIVLVVRRGPELRASLLGQREPTATATRAATPTSAIPPTSTPTVAPSPTRAPTVTPLPPSPTPRPAPTALGVNVLARVTPPEGSKLKVRASGAPTAQVLGELDKNAQVTVLEGPVEAGGLKWWRVDNGKGLSGWSAEGVGTDRYLVPIGWAK